MNEINTLKQGDEFVIPSGFTEEQTIKMIAKKYNANLYDFKCIASHIVYSPIKIGFVPKGHDVISVWNEKEKKYKFYLRPIEGFSEQYLKQDTFIPIKETETKIEFESIETDKEQLNEHSNLHKAKTEKNDEFYTRLEDVVNELKHYKEHFKDKIIYCPCDKVYNFGRSSFAQYFLSQFNSLGVKKLVCTQYNPNGNGIVKEIDFNGCGIKWEYNGEEKDSDYIDESKINTYMLDGDGSFYSKECIDIMKNCDIVITNPPFSLFRKFVGQIMDLKKKFLIIGNMNAITYKEIFPLIKNNEIWLGYNTPQYFEVPLESVVDEKKQHKENGKIYQAFGNICWYTNLEHNKRKEKLFLHKKYSEETFPKYDNYNAIEVKYVKDIPCDYEELIGVPISFLHKYCPEQFEIIGLLQSSTDEEAGTPNLRYYNNFKEMRQDGTYTGCGGGKANGNPVLKGKSKNGNFLYCEETNEYVHSVYARILIKKII